MAGVHEPAHRHRLMTLLRGIFAFLCRATFTLWNQVLPRFLPFIIVLGFNFSAASYALFLVQGNKNAEVFFEAPPIAGQLSNQAYIGFALSVSTIIVGFTSLLGLTFGYLLAGLSGERRGLLNFQWAVGILLFAAIGLFLIPLYPSVRLVDVTKYDPEQLKLNGCFDYICAPPPDALTFWRAWFLILTFVVNVLGSWPTTADTGKRRKEVVSGNVGKSEEPASGGPRSDPPNDGASG